MIETQKGPIPTVDIEAAIQWVLDNPHMSPWLKTTLSTALLEDPIRLANDLEILRHLLVPRTQALLNPGPSCGGATGMPQSYNPARRPDPVKRVERHSQTARAVTVKE